MKPGQTRRPPRCFRVRPSNVQSCEAMRVFRDAWISMLWQAMNKTGEGYPRPKARRREDRREDKLNVQPADPRRFERRLTRSEQQALETANAV